MVSFGVVGAPLYSCAGLAFAGVYQCPECHSMCNTNRPEQATGCSENLDPFWMGLVMTFNPATLNIEIRATGQDVNLIYLF